VLYRVLRKMISSITIPFRGEPLGGLQVMGMLETRALDFPHIILLSANEGVLPKGEPALSFIPYNLRRGFGLPTIEQLDAMYAYYFYRLIQRAQNVALVYNSQGNGRSGEMSRFLFQMKYEQSFQVNIYNQGFSVSLADEQEITIPKNEQVMQALYQYTSLSVHSNDNDTKYLTPTALNAYLACSLRFYFRYVAHIREKEVVTEDIEGSMFGKLLHNAMQRIYTPYLGKTMTTGDFDKLQDRKDLQESIILRAFADEFFKKENETPQLHGKSLVIKEVLRKYIVRILEYDRNLAPLVPLGFEKTFQTLVTLTAHENLPVRLGGQIDRIDKTGDTFRVIDYKTGKVEYKFESIGQLFEVAGKKQNKEALQVLLYAYLLSEDKDYKNRGIVAGLYGMRDIFKKDFDYHMYQAKGQVIGYFSDVRQPYLEGLEKLLAEIFDPRVPFTKVADKKVCGFCDYRAICHR